MAEQTGQETNVVNLDNFSGMDLQPYGENITSEAPTEQPTAPNEETPKQENTEQPTPQEQTPQDWLQSFNKDFEKDYKSKDEIKTLFENNDKVSVYEKELEDYRSKVSDFEKQREYFDAQNDIISQFEDQTDVVKQFGSKENYVAWKQVQSLKEKNIDEATAVSIVTGIDGASNFQAALLQMKVDYPNIDNSKLEKRLIGDIYRKLKLDADEINMSDLPQDVLDEIDFAGVKAKKDLKAMVEPVEVPERKNFKELYENERKQKQEKYDSLAAEWEKESKTISLPDISIKEKAEDGNEVEVFKYNSGDFDSAERVKNFALKNGLDPSNEKDREAASKYAWALYVTENFNKILREVRQVTLNETKESIQSKYHNDKPLSNQEAPPDRKDPNDQLNDDLMGIIKQSNFIK